MGARVRKSATGLQSLQELGAENVTANLLDGDVDQAIMFMAPWCKYCKQLLPSWESIALLTHGSVSVTSFNCEKNPTHRELCVSLQVDRYPSLYFIGYGNFHQNPAGKRGLNQPKYPNLVKYVGDLYPEALYDWVVMLSLLSNVHRKWDDFAGIFTGRSRHMKKLENMQKLLVKAEKKANLFGKELEKYKANEIFDSLVDHGDVFPLLNKLEPDEQNLPLRACVADMATQYCKYHTDTEQYCQELDKCVSEDLIPLPCRPPECPFEDDRGCKVVSTCMKKDVIEEYKKLYV
eukprot:gene29523-35631_t